MFGALNQLADSQGIDSVTQVPMISTAPATTNLSRVTTISGTTTPGVPIVPAATTTAVIPTVTRPISMVTSRSSILPNKQMLDLFVDPMRELIHQSINTTCDPNLLVNFANQATNLQNFEIIPIQKCETSVSNLAGVFAGTETVVKKVEVTMKRKSSFLDGSDSDNMENTILGRLSRTRRAISANIRNISARSKSSARKLLIDSRSPSTSSLDSQLNANYDQIKPDDDQLDYAVERMTMIKESLKQTMMNNTEDTLKPIFNLFPPDTAHQEESSERISSSDEDIKKYTKKSKIRSKTAKTNRVTPAVDVSQRRGASAEQKVVSAEPESPPNPLQPWSVQGISNMNTILAWENEVNSE